MRRRCSVHVLRERISLLLFLAFVVSTFGLDENSVTEEINLEIERKLKLLNKPPVKSIQSEDGDIIDCVDIHKQPALDHPALKHHKIQMRPTYYPKTESTHTKNGSYVQKVSQIWQKHGSCPEGTIPIRRIRKQDLLRATSLDSFGRKNPYIFHSPNNSVYDRTPNNTHNFELVNGTSDLLLYHNRSTAFLVTRAYSYIGAKAEINTWSPHVEAQDEYTTAQIWLLNGPRFAFESVESGWTVNPAIYGDKATRFFAYWSADGSQKTGCFDLICQGFVQTNHEIALGGRLDPISQERGGQYHAPISIHLDTNTSAWWLAYGEKLVGYWPGDLFNALHDSAAVVQFGGEVFSPLFDKVNVRHTATAMGSGNFAYGRYGHAAFIKHVRIIDYSKVERYPEWVYAFMDEPYCYSALNHVEYIKEPMFYFGGPGRNSLCH